LLVIAEGEAEAEDVEVDVAVREGVRVLVPELEEVGVLEGEEVMEDDGVDALVEVVVKEEL
jgi:hypothetical protein